MRKQIDLLGYSPFNLPLFMDILHDSGEFNYFRVIQNIRDTTAPVNGAVPEAFETLDVRKIDSCISQNCARNRWSCEAAELTISLTTLQ
jgi:hypothetical protein